MLDDNRLMLDDNIDDNRLMLDDNRLMLMYDNSR